MRHKIYAVWKKVLRDWGGSGRNRGGKCAHALSVYGPI